jgi:formate dehydrogenase iron-sulfur subunit
MTAHEAELTAGVHIRAGRDYGFFTDTSLCIGCKACEVACKEWNALPSDSVGLTGWSYDNTRELSPNTWRHVRFVEKFLEDRESRPLRPLQSRWLMMSDVCKHCERAACLEACPTGSLFRTEFGTVVVQQDVCNGCGYCVPSCPFGVIELNLAEGKAHKCTLCYDRLKGRLEPACSKTCPTDSIRFGEVGELREQARARLAELHRLGRPEAYLYGVPDGPGATGGVQGLPCFFLLLDRPEVYNLPVAPKLPSPRIERSLAWGAAGVAAAGLAAAAVFLGGAVLGRSGAQSASGDRRRR